MGDEVDLSEDDDATSGNKEYQRATTLLDEIVSREKCSYDKALEMIKKDPKILEKFNIKMSVMRKMDLSSDRGRLKFKQHIFRQVITRSHLVNEMYNLLFELSGKKDANSVIRHCFEYAWPPGMLDLYILNIFRDEIKKLKGKYSADKAVRKEKLLNAFEMQLKMLEKFNYDKFLSAQGRDLRAYCLNAFEITMNKELNKDKFKYSKVYERDRARLMQSVNLTSNYIPNYNGINNNNRSSGTRGNPVISQARLSIICHAYNTPGGCPAIGCPLQHICFIDFGRHPAYDCHKVIDYIWDNRYQNPRIQSKFKNKNNRGNNNNNNNNTNNNNGRSNNNNNGNTFVPRGKRGYGYYKNWDNNNNNNRNTGTNNNSSSIGKNPFTDPSTWPENAVLGADGKWYTTKKKNQQG